MAKWLVKYPKNPMHNFLVIVCLFFLYILNHRYFGLDFWNENLDSFFNLFPFLLFLALCLNLWFFKKEKLLLVIQIFILFFVGLFYLVATLTWANETKIDDIDMRTGTSVEFITTGYDRDSYLMQENQLLFFFVKKKCLYSFSHEPSIDLTKIDDETLKLALTLKSTTNEAEIKVLDPTIFTQVYKCEGGSSKNIDPYHGIFSYWIRLLVTPFFTNNFDTSGY